MQEIALGDKMVLLGIADRKLSTGIASSRFRQYELDALNLTATKRGMPQVL